MMYYVACGLALVATLSSLGCSPRIKRQELSAETQQQLREESRRAPQPLLLGLGLALGAGLGVYLDYRVRRALR